MIIKNFGIGLGLVSLLPFFLSFHQDKTRQDKTSDERRGANLAAAAVVVEVEVEVETVVVVVEVVVVVLVIVRGHFY